MTIEELDRYMTGEESKSKASSDSLASSIKAATNEAERMANSGDNEKADICREKINLGNEALKAQTKVMNSKLKSVSSAKPVTIDGNTGKVIDEEKVDKKPNSFDNRSNKFDDRNKNTIIDNNSGKIIRDVNQSDVIRDTLKDTIETLNNEIKKEEDNLPLSHYEDLVKRMDEKMKKVRDNPNTSIDDKNKILKTMAEVKRHPEINIKMKKIDDLDDSIKNNKEKFKKMRSKM